MKKIVLYLLSIVLLLSLNYFVYWAEKITSTKITRTKSYYFKQKILIYKVIKKSKKLKKYVSVIDSYTEKASIKKLNILSKKLLKPFKISSTSKNINDYMIILDYFENSVLYEIKKRDEIKNDEDLLNWPELKQTTDYTYLTNNWEIIYIWKHESVKNPFIWDEWCKIIFDKFIKADRKQINYKQIAWDSLSENEKKLCLKDNYKKSIKIQENINPNFITFYKNSYETRKLYIYNIKLDNVIELELWKDEIKKINSEEDWTIFHYIWYKWCNWWVVYNVNWKNYELLKNNCDLSIDNKNFLEIIDYEIISSNIIKINYISKDWKIFKKEVNLNQYK